MLQLDILTPDKKVYSGEVKWVNLPGIDGGLEVHQNHAALITALGKGPLTLLEGNTEKRFDVDGGVVEVLQNKVIVLAESVKA
jgi:F-type H+-transporting ATPase subunit epsilon